MADAYAVELRALGFLVIETHISRVFLRGDDVYKLKRPVDFGFLDYSSLEKREAACDAEVELNRRLAPEVYLGVVALVRTREGLSFVPRDQVERDEVIEFAVHMRRLSDRDRADCLLEAGQLGRADIEAVARLLARFHEAADDSPKVRALGAPSVIAHHMEENFAQTEATSEAYVPPAERAEIAAYQRAFLRDHAALFERRASEGFVRDGHGDLRLEHLYRRPDGAYIAIDCIEFSERYRCGDVALDIAFLAMDLSHHGRADLSELFVAAYARERADYELYALLDFYASYRAFVRAKVASITASDAALSGEVRARAAADARRYYALARAACRAPAAPPRLIVTFGLMASGKSTLAEGLGERLAVPVLSADFTRKQLSGGVDGKRDAPFQGAYAPEATARVYDLLLERAEAVLRSGRSVVVDATFRARTDRARAVELARRLSVECYFLECRVPREEAFARLARRGKEHVSDARVEIYDAFAASFEPTHDLPRARHALLDTRAPPSDTLERALAVLGMEGVAQLR